MAITDAARSGTATAIAILKQRFGETQPVSIGDEGFSGADRYLGKLVFFRKGPLIGGFANLTEGNDGINQARALESAMP